jgi:hypothetical protein
LRKIVRIYLPENKENQSSMLVLKLSRRVGALLLFLVLASSYQAQSPESNFKKAIFWEKPNSEIKERSKADELINFHPCKSTDQDRSLISNQNLNKLSIFTVFYSTDQSVVFTVENQLQTKYIEIFNNNLKSDKNFIYPNSTSKPMVLTYSGANSQEFNSKTKSSLVMNKGDHRLAELIVFNRMVSAKLRRQIESYLSIKYGISLYDTCTYLDGENRILFKPTDHGKFNHDLTGIGRDDKTGLYQKQSVNVNDSTFLTIGIGEISGVNNKNSSKIKNGNFLLWANNGEALTFNVKGEHNKESKRIWKMMQMGNGINGKSIELKLKPEFIPGFDLEKKLWLHYISGGQKKILELKPLTDGFYSVQFIYNPNHSSENYFSLSQDTSYMNNVPDLVSEESSKMEAGLKLGKVSIIPNPVRVNQEFVMSIKDLIPGMYRIEVIDASGKLVATNRFSFNSQYLFKYILKSSGLYYIHLIGAEQSEVNKLICGE